MEKKKIVMLTGPDVSSLYFYNSLKKDFDIEAVILEDTVPRKDFLQKRIKRLGMWTVLGQVLFQVVVVKWLRKTSASRMVEICHEGGLSDQPVEAGKWIKVPSINSDACLEILQKMAPDIVVVNGTRIISKKILNGISATFINTHSGITPRYRGVHGGYWALVRGDSENCGVTVHLVDPGIDTGGILYQGNISPTPRDNFVTYTHLQNVEGIRLMKQAIRDALDGNVQVVRNGLDSHLWYHPTIWQYLYFRIFKGVK